MDIEEQYDKLLRYCYMKLHNRTLAEDITQESFIRFLESRNYQNVGKGMAYLYTIAGNLCIDYYRKKKEESLENIQEIPETESSENNIVEHITIESALDNLPFEEREAIVLRFMAELPIEEIGQILGLSRFSVHRRIASATKKLRKEMGKVENKRTETAY